MEFKTSLLQIWIIAIIICETNSFDTSQDLKVAAFNLETFGPTKAGNDAILTSLAQIIDSFDLVFLEEIRDVSGEAILTLQRKVNQLSDDIFLMTLSDRVGTSSAQEQFAYMYRSQKVRLLANYTYAGGGFEKNPFVAYFDSPLTAIPRFAMIGCRLKLSQTVREMNSLIEVYEEAIRRYGTADVIIGGDFHSDCSYLCKSCWDGVSLRQDARFVWVIGDDADTTLSSTDCSYDRLVVAGSALQLAFDPYQSGVYNFGAALGLTTSEASDRYPVYLTLRSKDAGLTPGGAPLEYKAEMYGEPLKIAAFNIQIFGQQKVSNVKVVDILKQILLKYDLVLVQEIRDSSDDMHNAIYGLLSTLNQDNPDPFNVTVSARLGRSSSKEQYAYLYRSSKLELVNAYVYDDSANDVFEREPYIAHFKSPTTYIPEFIIVGIHTKPNDAVLEIDHLVDVYEDIQIRDRISDVLFAGDFNGDCNYVCQSCWSRIRLRTDLRFQWLISDGTDTTIGNTDCAYDRFVTAGVEMLQGYVPNSAKVFPFHLEYALTQEEAALVSDHYPIEMALRGALMHHSKYDSLSHSELVERILDLEKNLVRN